MAWYQEARERNLKALELLGEAAGLLRQNAATMTDLGLSRHTHDMVDLYSAAADNVDVAAGKVADAVLLEQQHMKSRELADDELTAVALTFGRRTDIA